MMLGMVLVATAGMLMLNVDTVLTMKPEACITLRHFNPKLADSLMRSSCDLFVMFSGGKESLRW